MKLTRAQMDTLIAMFPNGCDLIEGRLPGHVHAEPLNGDGKKVAGVLLAALPDGGTGSLLITRESYFKLPENRQPKTERVS